MNWYTKERKRAELDAIAELMRRRNGRMPRISTETVFDSLNEKSARERLGCGGWTRPRPAQREEWEVA